LQVFGRSKVIYIVMPVVILLTLALGIAMPFIADSARPNRESQAGAQHQPLFRYRNTARSARRPEDKD
jgi:hypothetical protein